MKLAGNRLLPELSWRAALIFFKKAREALRVIVAYGLSDIIQRQARLLK